MRVPTFYLSVPVAIDWYTKVDPFIERYRKHYAMAWWTRGTEYISRKLEVCDSIVFFLPGNKWSSLIGDLPPGLQSELAQAKQLKKKLFIAYRTDRGIYSFYKAVSTGTMIEGIAGTAVPMIPEEEEQISYPGEVKDLTKPETIEYERPPRRKLLLALLG